MTEQAVVLIEPVRHTVRLAPQESSHAIRALVRNRDFRLLMTGQVAWLLGGHLYLIALPWLVLQLTGDVVAMGTAIILSGVPRIALMLMGGAVSDRFSNRTVMVSANIVRACLLALLAWLVFSGRIDLWLLYGFSFTYGLIDAFLTPARTAIVPLLVQQEHLQTANSIASGLEQLCGLVGPVAAGFIIAWASSSVIRADVETLSLYGIGVALSLDALATLVAVMVLWLMTPRPHKLMAKQVSPKQNLILSITEVTTYIWRYGTLRALFLMVVAINVLTTGPVWIGLPALAATRLNEGAAALGVLTSGLGAGALLGAVLAGLLPPLAPNQMTPVFSLTVGVCSASLLTLAFTASTSTAVLTTLIMGISISYTHVAAVTWMQRHTPPLLMGRMMSLVAMK